LELNILCVTYCDGLAPTPLFFIIIAPKRSQWSSSAIDANIAVSIHRLSYCSS